MRIRSFWAGTKMAIPVVFGFIPVAIAFAIMAADVGMTAAETICMSVMVFAGASQIMSVGMLAEGAGMLAIVIATFMMNLRHFIMGTCIFDKMEKTGIGMKLLCGFGVTDESFAIIGTTDKEKCDKWYFLGILVVTYLSWVVGTVIGALANAVLPEVISDSFGIALYAMFIALLVPNVKGNGRLLAVVVITAVINFILQLFMPSSWSLIVATLIGAGIGVFIVKDEGDTPEEVAQ